jgi:hypothetical protein
VVFLSVGEHVISINYSGDSNYSTEYAQRSYTVIAALTPTPSMNTSLIVQPQVQGSAPGEGVVFNVLVSPNEGIPPTGAVTLSSPGETGCTATLVNGGGSCTIQFNTPGEKTITATYPLTGQWLGSTASTTHLVNYPTGIVLTFSPSSPSVGQVVQASVVVSVVGGGPAPTGEVSISAGYNEACGDITLVDGRGTCTLIFNSEGERTVEALFIPADNTGIPSFEIFRDCKTSVVLDIYAADVPTPKPTREHGGG